LENRLAAGNGRVRRPVVGERLGTNLGVRQVAHHLLQENVGDADQQPPGAGARIILIAMRRLPGMCSSDSVRIIASMNAIALTSSAWS
jgi:hypothetical protein